MLRVVEKQVEDETPSLESLAREGARRMLTTALEAEVAEYVATHQDDGIQIESKNDRAA